ncbi:MAG: fructose-bisphosphatase, class II [Candidatus Fischerbacteria bacterium RBG_13_37_8]|uniref:Fructose-1,6-bisphosphatase n=1 Tax=Candidatus Fischerbacteria bacterium RBG_13_37_8 TaxID=1817863 RepID=A0A1F5VPC5_9BACT|nr:MAG: fructose-bisphosphatase, class II [Candidatus Fischerbacteria bacterium RBG_13_37_8]
MNLIDELSVDFLRVVEVAAVAAAKTMGQGDRRFSDHEAVEAMREELNKIELAGIIVIGEGERDEAPMLYINEEVGKMDDKRSTYPQVDIAVDPLEGTNLCATGTENAISVLAAAERGGLLNAPDIYMDKIIVGPSNKGRIDINAPVEENLKNIARGLNRDIEDLVIIVLNRDRHIDLIRQIRQAGARIKLISDGDLSAGIAAAMRGTGVHAVMGIGGAPEGVLTAAAMKCLNGDMQAKLYPFKDGDEERIKKMGIEGGFDKVYNVEDLAPGKNIVFAATGVTSGSLLKGIRFFGGGYRANSVIMTCTPEYKTTKFIDDIIIDSPEVVPVSLY